MIELIKTDFKLMFTDRKTLFTSIALPVLLIVILGISLSSLFAPSQPEKIKTIIDFETFKGTEKYELVKKWSENEEVKKGIELVEDAAFFKITFANNTLEGQYQYNDNLQASIASIYYKNLLTLWNSDDFLINTTNLTSEIATTIGSKTTINSISYYSVTMIILTIAYSMISAGKFIYRNLKSSFGKRLKMSSLSEHKIFGAAIITNIIVTLMQITIVIIILKLFFKDEIYDLASILIIIVAIIFYTMLGIYLSLKITKSEKFESFCNFLIPFLVLISGGYYKIDFGIIKYLSPNYWFTNQIMNNHLNIGVNKVALVGITILSLLIYFYAVKKIKRGGE